jgi:hypothetical protein
MAGIVVWSLLIIFRIEESGLIRERPEDREYFSLDEGSGRGIGDGLS